MTKFFKTLFFAFFLMVSQIQAQVGTTIQITDGFGSCTLNYDGIQNDKYRYKGFGCQTGLPATGIIVFWNFTNWEIRRIDNRPSYFATAYISTVETNLNPPDLSIGNWVAQRGGGLNLSVFSGTGTTNIPCLGTPTFTAGSTSLCTGATSTYTATATNVQTTAYSIVGGTGATIDASTGVVSNVTADFTVRATLTGSCGASKTVDRAVFYNCGENNALNFDGVDDNVVLPGFSSLTAYTIEAKIRPGDGQSRNIINGGDGNFGSYSHSLLIEDGKFKHRTFDGGVKSVTGATAIIPNQWYHVAITASNSGQMKLFVNGIEEGTPVSVATLWTGLNRFSIGTDLGASLLSFFGTIDEFRVWNVARTASQIQSTINSNLVGNESGLISYIKFDQGKAGGNNTTGHLLARATTGTNGTLGGFALTGASSNFVVGDAVVLPVELLSFTGRKIDRNETILLWKTADETNASHFDIERSVDGKTFEKISKINTKGSNSMYDFNDKNLPVNANILYYRLKMNDLNGRAEYSKIIAIASGKSSLKIKIYPTNTEGVVWIDDAGLGIDNVSVFNAVGQLVLTLNGVKQINLSAFNAGMYIIHVVNQQGKTVGKVFKQ